MEKALEQYVTDLLGYSVGGGISYFVIGIVFVVIMGAAIFSLPPGFLAKKPVGDSDKGFKEINGVETIILVILILGIGFFGIAFAINTIISGDSKDSRPEVTRESLAKQQENLVSMYIEADLQSGDVYSRGVLPDTADTSKLNKGDIAKVTFSEDGKDSAEVRVYVVSSDKYANNEVLSYYLYDLDDDLEDELNSRDLEGESYNILMAYSYISDFMFDVRSNTRVKDIDFLVNIIEEEPTN